MDDINTVYSFSSCHRLPTTMLTSKVTLNDGYQMPVIAFGTGTKWKGHEIADFVEQAIDTGFSHIDAAAFYENEASVGEGIKQSGLSRDELFITTKYDGQTNVEAGLEASLNKLGVKFVDLYLIHSPKSIPHSVERIWADFEDVHEKGLSRSIGVSNFGVKELQAVIKHGKIKPAVNQISLNPYNYSEMRETIEYCNKQGIVVEAYSSLAPLTRYPGGPVDKPLHDAAKRLKITPTQAVFQWVRAKRAVIVTTSSSKEHLKEYLAVDAIAPLTKDEIEAIDKAGAKGPPSVVLRKGIQAIALLLAFIVFMCYRTTLLPSWVV